MKEKEKLLDTNYLIGLLEGKSDGNDTELLQNLKNLRSEIALNNVEVVITPLIRYEFLRYFMWKTQESEIKKYINVMNGLTTLDISQDVAADLYRLDKFEADNANVNKNIDKRQFDIFHFATAKVNGIELLSNDKHLPQLEDLYSLYRLEKIL